MFYKLLCVLKNYFNLKFSKYDFCHWRIRFGEFLQIMNVNEIFAVSEVKMGDYIKQTLHLNNLTVSTIHY